MRELVLEGMTEEEFNEKFNEPGIIYNRFDADLFIDLIQDMQNSVHLDYFLLRYGITFHLPEQHNIRQFLPAYMPSG